MNKVISIFFLAILLASLVLASNETVSVMIKSNSSNSMRLMSASTESDISVVNMTEEEYNRYKNNPNFLVEKIYNVVPLLQDSIEITNATSAWNLQDSLINLTGNGQTVCVIDTGAYYNHTDLGGGIGSGYKIIGGYDFGDDDSDPTDVNGHGTHVAGIVSANGSIKGIAPGSNLAIVKIFSNDGSSSSLTLPNAINWCISHADEYNISVITMSIGLTDSNGNEVLHSENCDSNYSIFYDAVQNAVSQNITVIAASGNNASTTSIGVPACLSNVIPVSATTKSDALATNYANRNSLVKLLGVGGTSSSGINSTYLNGAYQRLYGTSMATPMVAGAIAIINQYLELSSQSMTPSQIETLLYDTGKTVSENSVDYSRINVYDALLSIDVDAPTVNLVSPEDNSVLISENQTFSCNTTDWQLENITLKIWNSTSLFFQETKNISGTSNQTSFNVTGLTKDNYNWSCVVSDANSNLQTSSSYDLTIGSIGTTLNSPSNNTYTKTNETTFNCSAETVQGYNLTNLTFYLWNNVSLEYNESVTITGLSNSSSFTRNLTTEREYFWTCESFNNESDSSIANNFTITLDQTSPVISSLTTTPAETSASISWYTNESTNYTISGDISSSSSSFSNGSHSATISSLSSSTNYNFNLTICDQAGNCNSTNSSFTTNEATVEDSSSSSSSGGSSSSTTTIKETELAQGVKTDLKKDEKMYFYLSNQKHTFQITSLSSSNAQIKIQSETVYLNLKVGESEKINLTSKNYYDLYVKLDAITGSKAIVTIKKIYEPIAEVSTVPMQNNSPTTGTKENISKDEVIYVTTPESTNEEELFPLQSIIIAAISISVIVWIILKQIKSYNKHKKEKLREYKKHNGKKIEAKTKRKR